MDRRRKKPNRGKAASQRRSETAGAGGTRADGVRIGELGVESASALGTGRRKSAPRNEAQPAAKVDLDARDVRVWPLAVIFGVQALLLAIFYAFAGSGAPASRIEAFDALALPGGDSRIAVRVDQDVPPLLGVRSDAVEVTLWSVDGGDAAPNGRWDLGTLAATTSRNGTAIFEFPAPMDLGLHALRARVRVGDSEPLESPLGLWVVPSDRPLVLTTIRHTLWSPLAFEADGDADVPRARPAASDVLGRLAADHTIVYIEFLPRRELPWIREWLRENGFPAGPVLFVEDFDPREHRSRAPRLVALVGTRLQPHWKHLARAFGSDDEETRAFAELGIPTIHIGTSRPPSENPRGVVSAQSWTAVDDIIGG